MKTKIIQKPLAVLLSILIALPLFGAAAFALETPAGFIHLPKAETGLQKGEYWYNAAAAAIHLGSEEMLNYEYYLNTATNTLRIYMDPRADFYYFDIDLNNAELKVYANFLHQVGFDSRPGYRLPTSEEGLEKGAYWFDIEAWAKSFETEVPTDGWDYWLSDDGNTLYGYFYDVLSYTVSQGDAGSFLFMSFLHQAGVDLFEGMLPVCREEADIPASGGYLLNVERFIDIQIRIENQDREAEGKPPYTSEEEAQARATAREDLDRVHFWYDADRPAIGVKTEPYDGTPSLSYIVTKEIEPYSGAFKEYASCLTLVLKNENGIALNSPESAFDGKVELQIEPVVDGAAFELVEKNSEKCIVFDITTKVNGVAVQPNGKVTVKIPVPDGFDLAKCAVYRVSETTGKLENMHAKYEDGCMVFETDHFSVYAVVVEKAGTSAIAIVNYKASRTVDYRTTITFKADVQNEKVGAEIHWFLDGKDQGAGDKTFTVKEAKGAYSVQVKYMKDGGILAESETEKVNVKTGFFAKLIAFFRALFGLLPKETQDIFEVQALRKLIP